MKRTILLGTVTAALLAPFAVAQAQSNVIISVNTPEFGIRIGGPVFHPVPVYAPFPVFAPAPVIVVPPRHAPRHFGPRAGVWVGPRAGIWVAPRAYHHRDWDDRRDGRREHRGERDRDGYRAGYRY